MSIEKIIRPRTVEDCTDLLATHHGKAQILAGGTDLIIDIRHQGNRGDILIDISHLEELQFMDIKEHEVVIGAGTTFTEILKNEEIKNNYEALWKACKSIGSPQIRNRGTIGGNICNASPAADTVPPLLALNAKVVLLGKNTERSMDLKDFYKDKGRVDLGTAEFLYAVRFKTLKKNQGLGFEKIGFRKALAISKLSCAVYIELEADNYIKDIRIATGALSSYPKREILIEQLFKNKYVVEVLEKHLEDEVAVHISKRLKGRESDEYKSTAVRGIFVRCFKTAVEGAKNHDAT